MRILMRFKKYIFKGSARALARARLGAIVLLFALLGFACGGDPPDSTAGGEKSNAPKKLIVASDTTLVPMSFIGDNQKLVGFEPDLMKAIAKDLGVEIELISVEWPGLFGGLITRRFDVVISSVTILEERKKRMAFSVPYLQSGLALVVLKGREGIESMQDVKKGKHMIGAQVGTTAYFYLEKDPAFLKKGYQAYGHAIADLINGEIDAVLGESTGALYYKNKEKERFKKIRMVGEMLTQEFYGVVLRKEDKELLAQINGALTKLLRDGTIRRLHDKWDLGKAARVPEL